MKANKEATAVAILSPPIRQCINLYIYIKDKLNNYYSVLSDEPSSEKYNYAFADI